MGDTLTLLSATSCLKMKHHKHTYCFVLFITPTNIRQHGRMSDNDFLIFILVQVQLILQNMSVHNMGRSYYDYGNMFQQ